MSTINDPTVYETTVTVADLEWVKADHGSYTNYRTDRFFVGQNVNKTWHLSVRNAKGEFDRRSRRPEVFRKAEDAQLFAALLAQAEEAAA